MNIGTERIEYKRDKLDRRSLPNRPFELFSTWLNEAVTANVKDATAMALGTVGEGGFPESRIVLLKEYGEEGFTFFTNYNSAKGKSIEASPKVSLHFFWSELERQVRITGAASKTDSEKSTKYFISRPLGSQIAAVISDQSQVILSRDYLEERYADLKNQLKDTPPICPENWGGYLVKPVKIEFWQGRENRLHDRFVYESVSGSWQIKRLAP